MLGAPEATAIPISRPAFHDRMGHKGRIRTVLRRPDPPGQESPCPPDHSRTRYGSLTPLLGEGELYPPPAGDGRERFFRLHMSERTIEGLRIQIDRDLCVSFGDCIEAAPGVFEFDDEEIAVFVSEAGPISREGLIEACASCPVDALTAFDEEGEQLAP